MILRKHPPVSDFLRYRLTFSQLTLSNLIEFGPLAILRISSVVRQISTISWNWPGPVSPSRQLFFPGSCLCLVNSGQFSAKRPGQGRGFTYAKKPRVYKRDRYKDIATWKCNAAWANALDLEKLSEGASPKLKNPDKIGKMESRVKMRESGERLVSNNRGK